MIGFLGLALLDAVSDDMLLSGVLVVLHVALMTMICGFYSGHGILHT